MKTIKRVIIALLLLVVMVLGVVGCNAGTQNDLQSKIDELQSQIEEMEGRLAEMEDQIGERDKKIEQLEELAEKCTGTFYSLQEAYDNGWLTQSDLQAIANYHHDNSVPYPESLNDYIAKSIKKSWAKKLKDDNPETDITEEKVAIRQYYGTYNECVAVIVDRLDAMYPAVYNPYTVEIGNVTFTFNNPGPVIMIFRFGGYNAGTQGTGKLPEDAESVGAFCTLQEAYDNGWLTQADLMSIAYYHNGGQRYNEEIMSEDYEPALKTPEILSKNVDLAIRQTLVNDLNKEYDSDSFALNNIVICAYYGTYNGSVAIRMVYSVDGESGLHDVISENSVVNVKFRYTDYTNFFQLTSYTFTNAIMIWKENS